jgi:hypothetical protein
MPKLPEKLTNTKLIADIKAHIEALDKSRFADELEELADSMIEISDDLADRIEAYSDE